MKKDVMLKNQFDGTLVSSKGAIYGLTLALNVVKELRNRNKYNCAFVNSMYNLEEVLNNIINEIKSLK